MQLVMLVAELLKIFCISWGTVLRPERYGSHYWILSIMESEDWVIDNLSSNFGRPSASNWLLIWGIAV